MSKSLHARLVRNFLLIVLISIVLISILAAGILLYVWRDAGGQTQIDWVALRRVFGLLLVADVLVLIVLGVLALYLARRQSAPLDNLVDAVEGLAHGELSSYTADPADPVELRRLVQAYNDMAERMQDTVSEMHSFVAYASHELRTPLTSIKLRVEALRDGALDDRPVTDRFLSEIESEVDRLSRMVNDLLDLSRIEAGLEAGGMSPLNLAVLANDVYETYLVRAERAGVHLSYTADPDLPLILGEEDQLRRMFYNLVDNAIKYTPRDGAVTLKLQRSQAGDKVELLVQDTGFGIPKEHLPHIFERFYRVEATRPRFGPAQGSGLGLAIARTIVESHGGRIWVVSQISEGSTFGVEFPVFNGANKAVK